MSLSAEQLKAKFPRMSADCLKLNAGMPAIGFSADTTKSLPGGMVRVEVAPPVAAAGAKKRLRQHQGDGMNGWERAYLARLKADHPDAHIHRPVSLPLCNGVVYKIDFLVGTLTDAGIRIEGHEIKGRARPTGIVKIKMAAQEYPWISFFLATKQRKGDGGGWDIEPVRA